MQCFGQSAHARGNTARNALPVGIEPTTKTNTLASTNTDMFHKVYQFKIKFAGTNI